MLKINSHDREKLIDPLLKTGPYFTLVVSILLLIIAAGVVMLARQFYYGLAVTGMQRPVYWGLYMTNFIFFIGVSLAGTLTSAILRIIGAEWRRPITRVAEVITVCALVIAAIQIIVDMGRPDRLINVFLYGRLQSPILWDVNIVNIYLLCSSMYLYLPLIPDAAILRDNLPEKAPVWRHWFYRALALGWRGNVEQWRRLEKAVSVMAIMIIPVAVSVHTITSWLLATTVQPGWHSTVFGPYFVVTAIFSGIAALFLVMSSVRYVFGLEEYITLKQYRNLGYLFVTMAIVWGYFTYTESLTLVAGQQMMEFPVLASKLWGEHAPAFWLMLALIGGAFWISVLPMILPRFVIELPVLQPRYVLRTALMVGVLVFILNTPEFAPIDQMDISPDVRLSAWVIVGLSVVVIAIGAGVWSRQHPVASSIVAGSGVLVGAWLERWNIVVPTLTHPRLIPYTTYTPTATEIIVTISSVALFILMMIIFFKLFPAVSIWEIEEGRVVEAAYEDVTIPVPEPSKPLERRWRRDF